MGKKHWFSDDSKSPCITNSLVSFNELLCRKRFVQLVPLKIEILKWQLQVTLHYDDGAVNVIIGNDVPDLGEGMEEM